ncbi:hypothetical protein AB1Y20_021448 [Prymnesium parvum]|uniref:MSP domain-containing protein n=1 Tax=Prymnesium parvum TaxID=97485 RepID=A0AB34JJN2_PRYPA
MASRLFGARGATSLGAHHQHHHLPHWSEKILAVRAPAALLEGFDVAVLPLEDERRNDVGVAVSPGLYRPDENGMIHIRVVNASTRPVAIPMLTPIARFIIDPKSDDSDIQFTTEEILEKINIEENCTAEDRAKIAKMLTDRAAEVTLFAWRRVFLIIVVFACAPTLVIMSAKSVKRGVHPRDLIQHRSPRGAVEEAKQQQDHGLVKRRAKLYCSPSQMRRLSTLTRRYFRGAAVVPRLLSPAPERSWKSVRLLSNMTWR